MIQNCKKIIILYQDERRLSLGGFDIPWMRFSVKILCFSHFCYLHCLYFASFKLFNRIISMYLFRANIHNHKHTHAEVQMQTDMYGQISTYRSFILVVCQCVAILMFFFFFKYVPLFQLIYNFHWPFKFKFYFKLVVDPHDAWK